MLSTAPNPRLPRVSKASVKSAKLDDFAIVQANACTGVFLRVKDFVKSSRPYLYLFPRVKCEKTAPVWSATCALDFFETRLRGRSLPGLCARNLRGDVIYTLYVTLHSKKIPRAWKSVIKSIRLRGWVNFLPEAEDRRLNQSKKVIRASDNKPL